MTVQFTARIDDRENKNAGVKGIQRYLKRQKQYVEMESILSSLCKNGHVDKVNCTEAESHDEVDSYATFLLSERVPNHQHQI